MDSKTEHPVGRWAWERREAVRRGRSARGPMAAQAADRAVRRADEQAREAGYVWNGRKYVDHGDNR